MEFFIELVLDLILEGSIEASTNKKIPKFIRYSLIGIIILIFAAVILGLFILGITLIEKDVLVGIFMIIISLLFLIATIIKFKKIYLEMKD